MVGFIRLTSDQQVFNAMSKERKRVAWVRGDAYGIKSKAWGGPRINASWSPRKAIRC